MTILQPTLHVFGTADPVGSADLWRRVAAVRPNPKVRLWSNAGHMRWFDDSRRVAGEVSRLLAA